MNNLFPIAGLIADLALNMGGSYVKFYKAVFCPGKRTDGTPCFKEDSGASWIECPICKGRGAIYRHGIIVPAVYTDNSNRFTPDQNGGMMQGKKTLSLPRNIDAAMLKSRSGSIDSNTSRRILKDKFILLDRNGTPVEVLYLQADPVIPTINSGEIYKIVEVANT